MKTAEPNDQSRKTLKLQTINTVLILSALVLFVLLVGTAFQILDDYKSITTATNDYIRCEQSGQSILQSSNYLTEQVRLYVITGNPKYVDHYFQEVSSNYLTTGGLSQLEELDINETAYGYMRNAMDNSALLMERELYAIRLVELAKHQNFLQYEKVHHVTLEPEDANLSDEEKINRAEELVFGAAYQDAKRMISNNITYSTNTLLGTVQEAVRKGNHLLNQSVTKQFVLIIILLIGVAFVFILMLSLVIWPLRTYANHVQKNHPLPLVLHPSFRCIAWLHNRLHEVKQTKHLLMSEQGEYDPLTDTMNATGFRSLCNRLTFSEDPYTMLLLEIDDFQQLNETHGNETGNELLQKTAKLLRRSFRTTDFIAHISQNTFAIIFVKENPEAETSIQEKIRTINSVLSYPVDNLPRIWVNVGIAFSEKGFTEELYRHANAALEQAKRMGGHNCQIYQKTTAH